MDTPTRLGLLVVLGLAATAVPARAQGLPAGVTQDMVDKGKAIFTGAGNCYACHGQNAQGMLVRRRTWWTISGSTATGRIRESSDTSRRA